MFTALSPFRFTCLALPLACLAASCGTLETERIVSLGDVEPALSVRRPEGAPIAPAFVDEDPFMGRKVITRMAFEPTLAAYVQRAIEEELGAGLDDFRVDFIGYRYAFYFPSRQDDFVIRVELASTAVGVSGEFEAVIGGDRFLHAYELFGEGWEQDIPHTGPEVSAEERTLDDKLESWADRRAYMHRLAIQYATGKLAEEVRAARP